MELIESAIRQFCEKNVEPYVSDWDKKQCFPSSIFKRLGEIGLMGMLCPLDYGGADLKYVEYVKIISTLSEYDPSLALSVVAHNSLCCNHILVYGNESQKQKWLPKLASGEWVGAWALTENNAGSDISSIKTKASLTNNNWVINGTKNFITNGNSSNLIIVFAYTKVPGKK